MAEIKQQKSGRYSVRIGNQKFNDLSKREAQRRADTNYQVRPDSETDSPNQKRRNAELGIMPGATNAARDLAIRTGTPPPAFDPTAPIDATTLTGGTAPVPFQPAPSSVTAANSLITSVGETQGAQTQAQMEVQQQEQEVAKQQGALAKLASSFNLADQYAKLQKKQGIPDMVKSLQQANLQLTQMQSQYQAQNQELGQQAVPEAFVIGQQNELAKTAAIKITAQASYVQALQGNLDLANHYVDKMIDFQAQDYQRQYDAQKYNLELALGFLDRADSKRAQEVQYDMDIRKANYMDLLDQKKATMQNMLLNGASAAQVQEAAAATSVEQLMSAAGRFGVDALAQSQLATDRAQRANIADQIRARGAEEAAANAPASPLSLAQIQGNVSQIDRLATGSALKSAVGPTFLSRLSFTEPFTAKRANAVADIQQLSSQLSIDSLISAKERGATFGALSDSELKILSAAGSKIASWAVEDNGKVVGYKASEKDFRNELDKISRYAKMDYLLRGGRPEDVGAVPTPDGGYAVRNSDGTITVLK